MNKAGIWVMWISLVQILELMMRSIQPKCDAKIAMRTDEVAQPYLKAAGRTMLSVRAAHTLGAADTLTVSTPPQTADSRPARCAKDLHGRTKSF